MKRLLILVPLVVMTACSTVTITRKGEAKLSTEPTYSKSMPFFLGGLVGEKAVDVKKICAGKGVKQVQTQEVFLDSFFAIITIAIYAPRTIKVWCEGGDV